MGEDFSSEGTVVVAELVADGRTTKWKAAAQARRAKTITGTERRRMRRRPRRSIRRRERSVKAKLVTATERDVSVGVAKPMSEKRVAEKYMSEFWRAGGQQVKESL